MVYRRAALTAGHRIKRFCTDHRIETGCPTRDTPLTFGVSSVTRWQSPGCDVVPCANEIRSGASDARADGADRNPQDSGRLRVGETEHLGQHERGATIVVERADEHIEIDSAGDRGPFRPTRLRPQPTEQEPASLGAAHVVDARVVGDGQQPGARRRLSSIRRQRSKGPHVDLLREVVGLLPPAEVGTQTPDVGLTRPHEARERRPVTAPGRERQRSEVVHGAIVAAGNQSVGSGDYLTMQCSDFQEAISARLDGEASAIEPEELEAHLSRCAACRAFATRADTLTRSVRVRPAEAVPNLTAMILAKAPAPARLWPRYALLWVGLTQLVLALPALAGDDRGASTHVARELGSWDIALAVGLLVVAWQPRRAAGLLPFALALAGAMALTAGLDIAAGHAPAAGEAIHLIDVVGVGALWLAARSPAHVRWRPRPQGLRAA